MDIGQLYKLSPFHYWSRLYEFIVSVSVCNSLHSENQLASRGLCSMNKWAIKHFNLAKKIACVKLKCANEHRHPNTALNVQLRKFILLKLHYLLLTIIHRSRHIWLLWPWGCWQVPFVPRQSCKHFQSGEIKLAGRKILDQELLHPLAIFTVNGVSHLSPLKYGLYFLTTLKSIPKLSLCHKAWGTVWPQHNLKPHID